MTQLRTPHWILICLLAGITSYGFAGKSSFYKWTDENGVTHYSEYKPRDQVTEKVDIRTGQSSPADEPNEPSSAQDSDNLAQNDEVDGDLKDPERCEAARKNLETLNGFTRVRTKDPDTGEIRYLTEEEKNQRRQQSQKAIDESC